MVLYESFDTVSWLQSGTVGHPLLDIARLIVQPLLFLQTKNLKRAFAWVRFRFLLAERAGFEPAVPVTVRSLSKRVPSAAQPSLRIARFVRAGFVLFNCRSCFAALPLIDHVFRKAEFVRHRNDFSVIQRRLAVKLSEHLVLICR